jgi:hypothetical protein
MKKEAPKIEATQDWEKAKNFIPKKDQIIIYDGKKENDKYIEPPRLKIGDGKTKVNDLPFEDQRIDITYSETEGILIIN